MSYYDTQVRIALYDSRDQDTLWERSFLKWSSRPWGKLHLKWSKKNLCLVGRPVVIMSVNAAPLCGFELNLCVYGKHSLFRVRIGESNSMILRLLLYQNADCQQRVLWVRVGAPPLPQSHQLLKSPEYAESKSISLGFPGDKVLWRKHMNLHHTNAIRLAKRVCGEV